MIISIVGGGATGITALRHLAELACVNPSRNPVTAVQLFDKSGFDGGVAYRTTSDQHLLNIKASRMSIVVGDSEHFLRWTEQRGLKVAADDNLPRKLYRDYLDDVRLDAIERCRSAGIEIHMLQAEVVRAQLFPNRDLLLTTDSGDIHRSSVMILCTGHNAAQDLYGLSVSRNYVRDPYSKFTFPDCDEVEVDILGSGLSAVDAATELASMHPAIHITCLSRSGLFPTVQPVTSLEIKDNFRASLHRYVQAHKEIQADAFAAKLSELLQAVAGISCDLSCQDLDTDALADLERNIAEAQTCKPNAHSYIAGVANIVCDAWSRMNPAEKIRFTDRYNSGWLRNRSAMPLASAVKVRDLMHEGRLSTVARLRDVKVAGGRFHIKLGGDVHREADYIIDATGPSYLLNTSPLYLDLDRQGIAALDGLGGISCSYNDGRVLDRDGNPQPNIYAVGGPTKGTHFFAGAVDINMQRSEAVIEAIFRDARARPAARPGKRARMPSQAQRQTRTRQN
jgi:uncharacterized NAD(P)/FAD-binding protein YdhS